MSTLFVSPWAQGETPQQARAGLVALLQSPGMASLSPIAADNIRARIALIDAHLAGQEVKPSTVYAVDTAGQTFAPAFGGLSPPMPHPDASNLALGPNLGGQDAVYDTPTTGAGVPGSGGTGAGSSGMGGLLLIGGAVILAVVLLGRK